MTEDQSESRPPYITWFHTKVSGNEVPRMSVAAFDVSALWQVVAESASKFVTGPDWLALALVWISLPTAAVVTFVQSQCRFPGIRELFHHILPEGTLCHPSARADFLFWLSRRVSMPLLVVPLGL